MHHQDAILFSSLPHIKTKLCVQYLSKRDYGFREKVERTDGRTNFQYCDFRSKTPNLVFGPPDPQIFEILIFFNFSLFDSLMRCQKALNHHFWLS